MDYKQKYLKYKQKYIHLKQQGGMLSNLGPNVTTVPQQSTAIPGVTSVPQQSTASALMGKQFTFQAEQKKHRTKPCR